MRGGACREQRKRPPFRIGSQQACALFVQTQTLALPGFEVGKIDSQIVELREDIIK